MLIRIAGGIEQALCAEPAVAAFQRAHKQMRITVCNPAADLYVGHPAVSGIMYQPEVCPDGFDRIMDWTANAGDPTGLVSQFAHQAGVTVESQKPTIYVTSMDRLRIGRFGLASLQRPVAVIILPEGTEGTDVPAGFETLAADIEERLGGSAVFISMKKYTTLENGTNLTGRLMPREMAAVIGRADGWIGLDLRAACLGWAAGGKGILLVDELFDSPSPEMTVQERLTDREMLLEAVSQLFNENNAACSE